MNIALVPARCGSKSIPFKNIKNFCGKPLIYWTLTELEKASNIDAVYVATDCAEIKSCVQNFNFKKVKIYDRKEENARDQSSTEALMLEFIAAQQLNAADLLLLSQLTNPFVKARYFDEAFALLRAAPYDSVLTCARLKRFFWSDAGEPVNYNYKSRPRRQDFDGILIENGAFYINSVQNIVENENRLSSKIGVYEMPAYSQLELDEPEDWEYAERLMVTKHLEKSAQATIKVFATDVDGVLTDTGMYYSENGDELKKFSTLDGKGIELLRNAGIKTVVITSEDTEIVTRRARKLKFDYVFQGVKDKLAIAEKVCSQENISLNEFAYIGDDINDFELLAKAGLSACPSNAVDKVKSLPIIKLTKKGGDGAVREFVDNYILIHSSMSSE